MILEISYTLQLDKNGPVQESWTYFFTNKKDFKSAVKDASKYFKTFVSSSGWSRKAKLKQIIQIRNTDEVSHS